MGSERIYPHGRPVAVLSPPPATKADASDIFGCMRGSVVAPAGFDFMAPVLDEELDAAER